MVTCYSCDPFWVAQPNLCWVMTCVRLGSPDRRSPTQQNSALAPFGQKKEPTSCLETISESIKSVSTVVQHLRTDFAGLFRAGPKVVSLFGQGEPGSLQRMPKQMMNYAAKILYSKTPFSAAKLFLSRLMPPNPKPHPSIEGIDTLHYEYAKWPGSRQFPNFLEPSHPLPKHQATRVRVQSITYRGLGPLWSPRYEESLWLPGPP